MNIPASVKRATVEGSLLKVVLDSRDAGDDIEGRGLPNLRAVVDATVPYITAEGTLYVLEPFAFHANQAGEIVNSGHPDDGLIIPATTGNGPEFLYQIQITWDGQSEKHKRALTWRAPAPEDGVLDLGTVFDAPAPEDVPGWLYAQAQVEAARVAILDAEANVVQLHSEVVDLTAGNVFRDDQVSSVFGWSSQKIDAEKADKVHSHSAGDLPVASTSSGGVTKLATIVEATGIREDIAVTPAGLKGAIAGALPVSVTSFGAVGNGVSDDTVAVQAAIAAADGGVVHFPAGTYLVTESLVGFWDTPRTGDGVLTDGTHEFHVSMSDSDTNTLRIDSAGDDANDGLFPGTARKTLAGMRSIIYSLSAEEAASGQWVFELSGTIAGGVTVRRVPRFKQPLVIRGEPLVSGKPVTKIQYATGSSETWGLRFDPAMGMRLLVENIEFDGFNTTYGYGILMKSLGMVEAINCVARNCSTGFAVINNAVGIFDNCESISGSTGFMAQYSSTATWRYCLARDAVRGFYATRNSVTHLDYSEARDNTGQGLWVEMAARVAIVDTDFKRNAIGILSTGSGEWDDQGARFHIGTADANTIAYRHRGVSRRTRTHSDRARNEMLYIARREAVSASGSSIEFYNPASDYVLPQGFLEDERQLRFKLSGGMSGTSGDKTLEFRLGNAAWTESTSVVLLTMPAATTGAWDCEVELLYQGGQIYANTRWDVNGSSPQIRNIGTAFTPPNGDLRFKVFGATGGASTLQLLKFEMFIRG